MREGELILTSSLRETLLSYEAEGVYPSGTIFGYETAAYLENLGNGRRMEIVIRDSEDGIISPEHLLPIEGTSYYYTSPLQTFCDILNHYEFVTGEQYEICVNIYYYYHSGVDGRPDRGNLYELASQYVSKEILDDNWEDLLTFYDH